MDKHLNKRNLLAFGFTVSSIATLGSLYFSFGMGLIPCQLCWFQRILMYPIPVILGISLYESNFDIAKPVLVLSLIGIPISTYHTLLQRFEFFQGNTCGGLSCSTIDYQLFDLLTIPNMALIAFILVLSSIVGSILLEK